MNDHPPRRLAAVIFAVLVLLSCLPASFAADITNLRCEYLTNPLGIDVEKPRLSWVIAERTQNPESRNQRQTAFQVLVASTPEILAQDQGDLWDSGKVTSDQSIQVEYAGKALTSTTRATGKCEYGIRTGRLQVGVNRHSGRWAFLSLKTGMRSGLPIRTQSGFPTPGCAEPLR